MKRRFWREKSSRFLAGFLAVAMVIPAMPGNWAKAREVQASDRTGNVFINDFADASFHQSTRIRWWIPGGKMTEEEISRELEEIAAAGFGGVEVVPVSSSGEGGDTTDWGSEQWNKMMKFALEKAGELGMTIDFTMTPAWPLALPSITDVDDPDSGAQLEVDGACADGITKENPYHGPAPVSSEAESDAKKVGGTPVLVAVTTAKYADKEKKILDYASAETLPLAETVSFTPDEDGEYVLFAWWQHPSGETKYGNNQVDHYGRAGSKALIQYWKENLIPYYGDAFAHVQSLFVDSLEYTTHLDWTWGLLNDFEERYQYDISPYLPAVYQASCSGNYMGEPVADFTFDQDSTQVINDYKDELTQLYIENHLEPLRQWCESMGKTLRYQTSYGKTLETAQTAMFVDIPETESLYGKDKLDFYRLQAGAVHMSDKDIYSIETAPEYYMELDIPMGDYIYKYVSNRGNGEEFASNYQQTWTDLVWHMQRAYVGGVNQLVVHGFSYNGQYEGKDSESGYVPGTVWPGFEGFGSTGFSNSWGSRQPNWTDAPDITSFFNRNQLVLQQGEAKVDLGIYAMRYYEIIDSLQNANQTGDIYTDGSSLEHAGYSYDFLSPAALKLDNATVTGGVLDEEGPGYKALIFDNESSIPQETAEKLLELSKAGFPLIFVGTVPEMSSNTAENDTVKQLMDQVMAEDTTRIAESTAHVPAILEELGVNASAQYNNSTLLTAHRRAENTDFYYLYNDGGSANYPGAAAAETVYETVTLEGNGRPYYLDAWTGEIKPVASYTTENGKVTFDVSLKGNESALYAVTSEDWGAADHHIVSGTDKDMTAETDKDRLLIKSTKMGRSQLILENGEKCTVQTEDLTDFWKMSKWSLTVDGWSEGSSPTEMKHTTYDCGELEKLVPWNSLEAVGNQVSGIGTYKATLTVERGWKDGYGLMLDLGQVTDTYSIKVNGREVPADQVNTCVDIGKYLMKGENIIEVTVASTLLNAVLSNNKEMGTYDYRQPDEYGILNEVQVIPYQWSYVVTGERQELDRVYSQYQVMDLSGYTQETIAGFETALRQAKTVLEDPYAAQKEIEQAVRGMDRAAARLQRDLSQYEYELKEAKEKAESAQRELEALKNSVTATRSELETARREAEAAKKAVEDLKGEAARNAFREQKVKVKTAKSKSKKILKAVWKKISGADGYQIQYSTKGSMKSSRRVTAKGSASAKTIKHLKSGRKYYLRVRAYKIIGGRKVYTKYSAKKMVRVK